MRNRALCFGRLGALVALGGGILVLLFQPQLKGQAGAAAAAAANPPGFSDEFAKLGIKFEGAASCSNSQCHGAD